jgi:predicted transcriptional regulator
MPRRERWDIIGAILQALDEQWREHGDGARVTNVALRANLSYDRMMLYLQELQQAGLITNDRMPHLTEKGREFLALYRQWIEVLGRFGVG